MYGTYFNCYNLTGNPVCGDKVTNMSNTYNNCYNLTGSPVCGPNVINMFQTYYNCYNLYGNMYIYSDNVSDISCCFSCRDNSKRLNIYVNNNTTSFKYIYRSNEAPSIVHKFKGFTWTNDTTNGIYYNEYYNIYVYAVDNVRNYVV